MSVWENDESDANAPRGRGEFSMRAHRMLVRVLLALRGEAKRSPDSDRDNRYDSLRAEALADRIMLEFPRRVLPLGLAALAALVIFCSLPLVRDAIGQGPVIVANTTMTNAVESGLRQRGSEMSDGIEALKAIVVPFTSDDAPLETSAPIPPFEATAPFKSS